MSIVGFLRMKQSIEEATCIVYPGQKADVNAIIAYFPSHHFLAHLSPFLRLDTFQAIHLLVVNSSFVIPFSNFPDSYVLLRK